MAFKLDPMLTVVNPKSIFTLGKGTVLALVLVWDPILK